MLKMISIFKINNYVDDIDNTVIFDTIDSQLRWRYHVDVNPAITN
jgi:hypothetical protein